MEKQPPQAADTGPKPGFFETTRPRGAYFSGHPDAERHNRPQSGGFRTGGPLGGGTKSTTFSGPKSDEQALVTANFGVWRVRIRARELSDRQPMKRR